MSAAPESGYRAFAREERLALPRCAQCGRNASFWQRLCPACGGTRFDLVACTGGATLTAWTRYHRGYSADFPVPYEVACARLDEGPEVLGRLDGMDPPPLAGARIRVLLQEDGTLLFAPATGHDVASKP